MVVISSRMTKFYKYVFPFIWFGVLAVVIAVGLISGAIHHAPMLLTVPCLMVVFGYFLFKRLLWVLADEVRDGGDYLVVKNHGEEITVCLSNIMNVGATTNMNPPQVTLRLVQPTKFGNEVIFSPVRGGFSLNPFRKNAIVEDLIVRVDKARSARAR
jgi:hypothetical protein